MRWGRGDAQGAIDELRGVIAERRDLTMAYDRLAYMLRASGRLPEAITVLDDAAKAGHADPSLLRSLGSMLRDAGDMRRSASVLEALVAENPADLQSADALAQTYTRMGRTADAEALFRRVLAASPNAAATWSNLGSLYIDDASHRRSPGRAVACRRDQSRPRHRAQRSGGRARREGKYERSRAGVAESAGAAPRLSRRASSTWNAHASKTRDKKGLAEARPLKTFRLRG